MKLIFQSEKSKRYRAKLARRSAGKRKRRKNYIRFIRSGLNSKNKERRGVWKDKMKNYDERIYLGANLSLSKNTDNVCKLLKRISTALEQKKSIFFNMDDVRDIDHSTIATLLAILYRSKNKGVRINGSMPLDESTRLKFGNSGFIYTLFNNRESDVYSYDINSENQIFTLDDDDLGVVDKIAEDVSKKVYDKSNQTRRLYTILGELVNNTKDHASSTKEKNERWWLLVSHDKVKSKVSFVFIDYGTGIFKSLENKKEHEPLFGLLPALKKIAGMHNQHLQLKSLIVESAAKVLKIKNGRGKGIHSFYQALLANKIQNLMVITNNAFGDVSNDNYRKLSYELNGTLYYWEICDNNKKK